LLLLAKTVSTLLRLGGWSIPLHHGRTKGPDHPGIVVG
jgi:hypothetical protein